MDYTQWPTNRLLATASRLTETTETKQFRDLGVTQAGQTALRVLSNGQRLSQLEIARKLRVRSETLGKVLEQLEHAGLIARDWGAAGSRKVEVRITREGLSLLDRLHAVEEERERTLGSDAQLRAELINRIKALGLESGSASAQPGLKLVRNDEHKADQEDGGDAQRSSATG